ncbi:DUF2231 domain-containing protein [Prosthecomicrobium pneumaticum]|uniref:Putative membrane protein n=1 Tax=Prosthecomicrobium pneumaticum TaxID=81895 RepID=A0A7W9L1V6_9HYPH|nr:putative membrane protein [Prosthecomicrobium pneumaticum]
MGRSYPNGSGSAAALFGHPLHPLIVPIPIGAFALAFVSDLFGITTGGPLWAGISFFLLAAGLIGGLLAAVFGIVEMMGVRRARTMGIGWAHGAVNVLMLAVAFFSLLLRREGWGTDNPPVLMPHVISSGVAFLLLLVAGWLGGELSYRHGVGVSEAVGSDREDGDLELTPAGRPDIGKR